MKIKLKLTIGFPGADHESEIDTVEDWGLSEDAPKEEILEAVADWAHGYIDYWYEEIE